MILNIDKLQTLKNWAATWKREVVVNGKTVIKTGCAATYAHDLFNADNKKPVAQRVRQQYQLVIIDGMKFVVKISDIPKQKK